MAVVKKANELKAELQLGKAGISRQFVSELKARLAKRKLVKVKVLPALKANRKLLAEKVALEVGAQVMEVKGGTIVFRRMQWKGAEAVEQKRCRNSGTAGGARGASPANKAF